MTFVRFKALTVALAISASGIHPAFAINDDTRADLGVSFKFVAPPDHGGGN